MFSANGLAKRITSLTLATLLILSNAPITTYASTQTPKTPETSTGEPNDMHSSAGGHEGESQVTHGGDWGNNGDPQGRDINIQRAGLRISLVDVNDPTKVVSIDKYGNPRVIDIILCSKAEYTNTCTSYQGRGAQIFTEVKTQTLNTTGSGRSNYSKPNELYRVFLPDTCEKLRKGYESNTLTELDRILYENLNMDNLIKGKEAADEGVPEPVDQLRWINGNSPYITTGSVLAEWLSKNKLGEPAQLAAPIETTNRYGDKVTPPSVTSNDKKGSSNGIKKQEVPKKQE